MPLTTLGAVIAAAAVIGPDEPAVVGPDRRDTFAELVTRADAIAGAVAERTPTGAVVALLGENSTAYVEALYGVPAAGRRLLLLNYRHHHREWAAMLARAGARLVVGDEHLLDGLRPHTTVPLQAFGDALLMSTMCAPAAQRDAGAGAVAWVVPTSGTTGTPKLAELTHRSLLTAARGCAAARPVAPDDVFLLAFPLCHVAAYNVIVQHLHARPVVLQQRFEARPTIELIAREHVTSASLAPTMIAALIDAVGPGELATLRAIGYGSSGMPEPLLRRAMEHLHTDFSQGYGMTELSGNCAFLDAAAHRRGLTVEPELLHSAGTPTPLVEVRIVADDGTPLPTGTVGEIAVRGEQVMAGYLHDPEATAAAIGDGWLRTGDLGRLDSRGRLFVVDRKKDVIVTGGENVASREVEAVLHAHPAVRDAAVIGVADEYYGEAVCAVVVLRPGRAAGADMAAALVDHCRARLAGYKKPRHVEFVDALPRNATGKVDKRALRRTYAPAPPETR